MFKWFEDLEDGLFTGSRAMGPPWGPILRVVRYPAALIRDWLRGEISVRAMSLAYTTLLSVVPLLVFSFSILKGLGARGDLKFILDQFFAPLGAASEQLTESVMQFVENMRGDLLGAIGLILGPILLAVALGLLASAERSPFAQWVDTIEPLAWILGGTGKVLPYLIVTIIFTFMYVFIPNTKVELRAALIGGITSGIVWALVGKVFTAFIVYSSSLVAIYTGFAIVLTTLIWVYLSWLILLIGAQLAFYLQFPQYLRHGQESFELTGRDREQVALSVMYLIGRDYAAGKTAWTGRALAAELDMPSIALAPVLYGLEQKGLILATEDGHLVPGKDIGSIQLAEIFEVIRVLHRGRLAIETHGVDAAVALLREVESAMKEPLRDRSLKDFIAAKA